MTRTASPLKTVIGIMLIELVVGLGMYGAYTHTKQNTVTTGVSQSTDGALCKDCNVILVSLDTLSSNHLPCYGYDRNTAPNLCTFGRNNILFSTMFSNDTWTLPSHVSMFTGLYPFTHTVNNYGDILPKTTFFLPEVLHEAGYKTTFVYPPGQTFSTDDVYNRGIDRYINEDTVPSWAEQLQQFKKDVDGGKKSFLFLHTYAVHSPYLIENRPMRYQTNIIDTIPITNDALHQITDVTVTYLIENMREFLLSKDFSDEELGKLRDYKKFADEHTGNTDILKTYTKNFFTQNPNLFWRMCMHVNYDMTINKYNPDHVAYIKALYDQRIHELDGLHIQDIVDFYAENSDIQKNTVFIITADHGDEFMEHGQIGHLTGYDSNLRVPLIIAVPGIKQKKITNPVQSVDIVPTLLDIIGIKSTSPFQGVSLVGAITGNNIPDRLLISDAYLMESKSIRWNEWKLFVHVTDGTLTPYELYDYTKDPNETTNVLSSHFQIAKQILQQYENDMKKWNNKK